jgi:hypothetical protein
MENPPTASQVVCHTCRQKVQPTPAGDSDANVISEGGQFAAPSAHFKTSGEVAPIGRSGFGSTIYSVVLGDRARSEQFEALQSLEINNRRPGANVSTDAEILAEHPELRDWLKESNRIADPKIMKGRADLVRQRRLGILRLLEGEDRGFPVHQPVPHHQLPQGQGFWLLRLRDELEWLVMPVWKPTPSRPYTRPTKDRLNHREARAILDWKASHLDMWLADRPHLVGGRLAIDSSRGVLFDTDAFIKWVYALMN